MRVVSTGTRRGRSPGLRPGLGVVLGIGLLGFAGAPAAHAAGRPCSPGSPGVVATLGTWLPSDDPDGDPITRPETYGNDGEWGEGSTVAVAGLASGRGLLVDDGATTHRAALRSVRRGDRVVRLELCDRRKRLATIRRPDPRGRIGGVSVNGDRIAWRVWRAGRPGTLSVGRIDHGRVVAVRTTAVPTLARADAINGRILVVPDGTAAWSLPVAGRAAVWLWPAGRAARRLVLPPRARVRDPGWDVRIVDDRHVILGPSATVLRYGPTTPGRCPTPVGATVSPIAGRSLVHVPGASITEPGAVTYWAQSLLCDPRVGDYVHVHATPGLGTKYMENTGGVPVDAISTAGVLVEADTNEDYGTTVLSEVTDLRTGASTSVTGGVGDPAGPDEPRLVGTPTSVRVLPGAVAWLGGAKPGRSRALDALPRRIWLADAAGVRPVGRLPAHAGIDAALDLTPTSLTWGGPAAGSTTVRPVPGATVERVAFPHR